MSGSIKATPRTLIGLLAAIVLAFSFALPALAEHDTAGPAVTPTVALFPGGDPICPEGTVAVRFGGGGGGSLEDEASAGNVTIFLNEDKTVVDFEAAEGFLVAKVFVKGGNDQNVYDYSGFTGGGVAHDDGLVAPLNEETPAEGDTYTISHIDFCVTTAPAASPSPTPVATPDPSPSPSPSPSPTPVATPDPSPSPSPTPVATPDPSPSPSPLPDTATYPGSTTGGGDNGLLLLLVGAAVLAATVLLVRPNGQTVIASGGSSDTPSGGRSGVQGGHPDAPKRRR